MKQKRYTEEQIAFALRQADSGVAVANICRKMEVSEATFYRWKKKFQGMGVAELRRLRQLEEENRKLKQLVADLTLDKQMLQDVVKKNGETASTTAYNPVSAGCIPGQHPSHLSDIAHAPIDLSISVSARSPHGLAYPDSRSGGNADRLGIPSFEDLAPTRGLVGQSQAGISALSRRKSAVTSEKEATAFPE
jgi:putative transposase